VLTDPLSGETYGFVVGMNPINLAPIGGAQFFVDEELADFDTYAIYWQYDDANNDGQPDYPPSVPMNERTALGELFLYGMAESPTRGVIHVHMTSLVSAVTAELAIFANIDEDELVAAIEAGFNLVDRGFTHALFGVVDDFEKSRRMLRSHETSSKQSGIIQSILSKSSGDGLNRSIFLA